MVRLACVYFPNEKRNYVVAVKDVLDLPCPRGIDDFDPKKLYRVRWPVLRRENSDTTEESYEGRVQLLAATPASMIKQASNAKPVVRLPQAFLKQHSSITKPDNSNIEAVDMAKKVSKKAKKQVSAALEKSCKDRMTDMLRLHKTNLLEAKKSGNEASDVVPSEKIADKGITASKETRTTTSKGRKRRLRYDDEDDETTESSVSNEVSSLKRRKVEESLEETIADLRKQLSALQKEHRKAQTDIISLELRLKVWKDAFAIFGKTVQEKAATPKPFFSNSSRVNAWVESTTKYSGEKVKQQEQGSPLPTSSLTTRRNLFHSPQKADSEFLVNPKLPNVTNALSADLNQISLGQPTFSFGNEPTSADKDVLEVESRMQEDMPSAGDNTAPSVSSPAQQKGIAPTGSKSSSPEKGLPSSPSKKESLTWVVSVTKTNTPSKSPKVKRKTSETSTPNKKVCSPSKVVKNKKSPAKPKKQPLGTNERSSKDLAPMIVRALKGEEQLQEDIRGKVLIGNNIYIKHSVWEKVKCDKTKLSIVVKDLAQEVWGYTACAGFSLFGGKSPKNPAAARKPPAPTGGVEAIFGVYRAKKIVEGMEERHIEESMQRAEAFLREKFADCDKKIKKENSQKATEQERDE